MRQHVNTVRWLLAGVSAVLVLYLSAVALGAPTLGGFGSTGSVCTILASCSVIAGVCTLSLRIRSNRPGSIPVGVIGGLSLTSAVLAISSFYHCTSADRPKVITALMWTATVVKGGVDDHSIASSACPNPTPVALEIARLAGLSAVFIGVISVAVALLQSQWDRTRIRIAKSVTAIIDLDEDARPMVAAIAQTLERGSQLAVLVSSADLAKYTDLRAHGARVLESDFTSPDSWASARWWRRIDKLYLLSADVSANLRRLAVINDGSRPDGDRRRLPLVMRIDDPWQAQSWRSRQLGQSDVRWLADAVSKYELAALRLLDRLFASAAIRTLFICGTSPLTLALCADIARRNLDGRGRDGADSPATSVTIVGLAAQEYRDDFLFRQTQLGLPPADWLSAVSLEPTMTILVNHVASAEREAPGSVAVILVDPIGATWDPTLGTRLAARFPMLPLLAWDANAVDIKNVPAVVGQLQQYRLAMDVPHSQGQDVWERAARLIHARYSRQMRAQTESSRPWAELGEFYRGSNRRQVRNAMWMVETIADHTWDDFGGRDSWAPSGCFEDDPLGRLAAIGFDETSALAMAREEHEDWCRYYTAHGWRYGPHHDDERKLHQILRPWKHVTSDHDALLRSLNSLADTLYVLRELGYRSRPLWRRYARGGIVNAERRQVSWTWTAEHGDVMHARAGDWSVRDGDGAQWSVRDDVFRATYRHLADDQWERAGVVDARPARAGETIDTLEGPVTAAAGSWVLRGAGGEQWPVGAMFFARHYSGPLGVLAGQVAAEDAGAGDH